MKNIKMNETKPLSNFGKNLLELFLYLIEKRSQGAKPIGFWGRIIAQLIAIAHRSIYKNVAAALNLQPEDDFLEVGCGSGIFMKSYASHVRSIAGLDHSEDMVKLASHYNRKRVEESTAEFRHGDAAQLPWKDEKISAVASMASFVFWPKPLESLKEIHRVLRPEGRLVISLGWNADDGMDHMKHIKKYGIKLYTGKEMQAMFQEAGFSQSHITYFKGFMMPRGIIACAMKK
jgi:SAM-dependent methyltransferase